jgi:hypothetical protein
MVNNGCDLPEESPVGLLAEWVGIRMDDTVQPRLATDGAFSMLEWRYRANALIKAWRCRCRVGF